MSAPAPDFDDDGNVDLADVGPISTPITNPQTGSMRQCGWDSPRERYAYHIGGCGAFDGAGRSNRAT